jgi:hypothetical protein
MSQQGTMRGNPREAHEKVGAQVELRLVVMYYMISKRAFRDISEEP